MARLNETIENIGKKEDHLQRKYDAEFANAKEFHAAGKTLENTGYDGKPIPAKAGQSTGCEPHR